MKGRALLEALKSAGLRRASGVPCSYFGDFYEAAEADSDFTYVPAANEGTACGIAAGWSLSGEPGVVLMQNSGLGNAVNPLTSLTVPYGLPLLLIVSGRAWKVDDEQQHEVMGGRLEEWLTLCGAPPVTCPGTEAKLGEAVSGLADEIRRSGSPRSLIVGKGTFDSAPRKDSGSGPDLERVLAALAPRVGDRIVVTTTGFASRAACSLMDRESNFYMQGSMGHAAAIGLGLALDGRDVIVLDGDAAALMHLGVLANVGRQQPRRFVHLLLNNGRCGSTGGQDSGGSADFPALARASGYAGAGTASEDLEGDLDRVMDAEGPVFLEIRTAVEAQASPRISETISHADIARRLQRHLRGE